MKVEEINQWKKIEEMTATGDSKNAERRNVANKTLMWTLTSVTKRHAEPQSVARAIAEPTTRIKFVTLYYLPLTVVRPRTSQSCMPPRYHLILSAG